MPDSLFSVLRAHCSGGVALAFSGGVDSALLLHALLRLQKETAFPLLAYYFHTPLHTEEETRAALCAAREAGAELVEMRFDPLQMPALRFNPPDRCYLCKKQLFSLMKQDAQARGLLTLMDGTHADDHKQYRPGLRALRELGVVSPLAAAGLNKAAVRALAAEWGLACSSKPSAPCLATRFEYGAELTAEAVRRVEAGEALLHRLFPNRPLRLRVHGNLARLELPAELMPRALETAGEIVPALRALGYHHISLDMLGFRSGSMDETHLHTSS
ncbi:MAG: ATP-dependent sacrificial sulfur transferase LarE [Akkermansiaceae bacterium]|nr:ATP-dependent sacrificial sulfur transferase LarE [Akkermansiaceae bacterium]